MSETKVDYTIVNELLVAILSQMYSIELLLADVYNGKANLRYSNEMLEKDKEVLDNCIDLVTTKFKEVKNENQNQ